MKEYDVVKSKKKLSSKVPKGLTGTIVMDYSNSNDFEVEFFDNNKETVDVITVNKEDLELI